MKVRERNVNFDKSWVSLCNHRHIFGIQACHNDLQLLEDNTPVYRRTGKAVGAWSAFLIEQIHIGIEGAFAPV